MVRIYKGITLEKKIIVTGLNLAIKYIKNVENEIID
jgi:hypothetical protein